MAPPLQEILEKNFNMMYYLHQPMSEVESWYLKEADWLYGRLVQQRRDEEKIIRGEGDK